LSLKTKVDDFFRFGSQKWQLRFSDFGLKIIALISWFWPKKQADFGLSFASQNRQMEDGAGHALRSGGLIHLEASRARVFQSNLKTGGCTTAGGVHDTIT
jgi:hypothetical protein